MNDIFINGHGSNGASGEKGGNLFIKSAGVLCKPEYDAVSDLMHN